METVVKESLGTRLEWHAVSQPPGASVRATSQPFVFIIRSKPGVDHANHRQYNFDYRRGALSGICLRARAEAFHAEGNQVIIAGRRKELLDETTAANPGMKSAVFDIGNGSAIPSFANKLQSDFPTLNVVIHNAGIMRPESLRDSAVADAEATIATNLLGPIRLTAALLPLLLKQPHATIMTVSSGLAFLPMATTPSYCLTKAAIHSYTQSLRYQLKDTSVQVQELIPPYVQTELAGARQGQRSQRHAVEGLYRGDHEHPQNLARRQPRSASSG